MILRKKPKVHRYTIPFNPKPYPKHLSFFFFLSFYSSFFDNSAPVRFCRGWKKKKEVFFMGMIHLIHLICINCIIIMVFSKNLVLLFRRVLFATLCVTKTQWNLCALVVASPSIIWHIDDLYIYETLCGCFTVWELNKPCVLLHRVLFEHWHVLTADKGDRSDKWALSAEQTAATCINSMGKARRSWVNWICKVFATT